MSGEVERAREARRFHRDATSSSMMEGRLRGLCRSGSRRTLVTALFLLVASPGALSGPVEVYREGDRYCPRNLPPSSPRIDAAEAGRIALRLVPDRFCGPTDAIGGCDLVTENFYDSWRVYVHQYRRIPNAHDWSALTHSYVILDAVGNCIANIPGTEPGAPR